MHRKTILIALILGTLSIPHCIQCGNGITDRIEEEFTEIEECIMAVHVDYTSDIVVLTKADVEEVFTDFTNWAQDNDKDIFGYGSNWRFEYVTIHGLYEGVKYWKVTGSWFSEEDRIWRTKSVFDVSENGEVVRLLGCI
jgi:hypothetical protein